MADINRITGHWESRVRDVSEQNITVGDLIQDENYDCIEWRVTTPPDWDEPDMLFGYCESVNGELIPLDGDTYSKSEVVVRYQKFRGGDVENGLTKIIAVAKPSSLSSVKFHSEKGVTSFASASIKTDLENYYQNLVIITWILDLFFSALVPSEYYS